MQQLIMPNFADLKTSEVRLPILQNERWNPILSLQSIILALELLVMDDYSSS
jgi:ubiquitin-protein ligase